MRTTDTEAETSEALAAQAAELRAAAEQARGEREAAVALAQQEAARLVAEAQQKAAKLWNRASDADREAEKLEERASYVRRVEQLHAEIPAAERAVVDLAQEADGLREQVEALDGRLAELGAERRDTDGQLAAAAEAGDVDEVVTARTRLAAVDDVTAALQRQRAALTGRLQAIGKPDGDGELNKAAARWQRLQHEHRKFLNKLDPSRPEAQADRLMEDLQFAIEANAGRLQQEQAAANNQRTNLVRTH